jgi:FkbM family methyltransferase
MNLAALMAAAYVEVQRATGRKPSLRARMNRLLHRPDEPDFRILRHLRCQAGRVCVDVGANRGETIASARLYQPRVPIVAFEPNPLLQAVIRDRHPNDPGLTLHPVGLGEHPGAFDLHVPYYKGVPFDGLASFRREEAANWLNPERLVGFDPRHQTIRTFNCRLATLDSFALAPAFMKIDVQGLEAAVVRGGRDTISAHLPVILMENNRPYQDAADLLARGYVAHALVGDVLVPGQVGDLNTFYIHPSTRDLLAAAAYGP